jgi:hypothetical protein
LARSHSARSSIRGTMIDGAVSFTLPSSAAIVMLLKNADIE